MGPAEMKYTINGNRVIYHCPKCGQQLESEIQHAGEGSNCPKCSTAFAVPGIAERLSLAETRLEERNSRPSQPPSQPANEVRQPVVARSDAPTTIRVTIVVSNIVFLGFAATCIGRYVGGLALTNELLFELVLGFAIVRSIESLIRAMLAD